ncbi:MAG TPA: DUF1573 domain-containing protein [Chthoniobacteraceae bacterium]|nr:DUF1573 domain-containing protein [Chthoniobacteraceae bacterium]
MAGALLLIGSPSRAELSWDHKEVHIKATPLETEVVARYPFKNEGTEPVKFKSFKSACGCVSITVSTMVVPPGAAGDVTVKFRPEFRIGDQKSPIAVQFDDVKQTRMALYLRVEIPEIIRPEPLFLKWGAGETLEPKTVTIITDEKYPVASMSTRAVNPRWQAKVTPIEHSRNYSLQVLPERGLGPQAQYVEVDAKLADGQVKRTKVYVVVR